MASDQLYRLKIQLCECDGCGLIRKVLEKVEPPIQYPPDGRALAAQLVALANTAFSEVARPGMDSDDPLTIHLAWANAIRECIWETSATNYREGAVSDGE